MKHNYVENIQLYRVEEGAVRRYQAIFLHYHLIEQTYVGDVVNSVISVKTRVTVYVIAVVL